MQFHELKGCTITSIEGAHVGSDLIVITLSDGRKFSMQHHQQCCESVEVESIVGDINNLIGIPILRAEEVSNNDLQSWQAPQIADESFTWTFYKLATLIEYVDIRWYGRSNGYYSESVVFEEIPNH